MCAKHPATDQFIGVDIGGTKVAAGIVDAHGQILTQTRISMNCRKTAEEGLASVISAIEQLKKNGSRSHKKFQRIGICAPGPLDPRTGVIINPPNVPCWRDFPLAEEIRRVCGVSATVDNDANAAALAEAKWGAARGYGNVFYATIGT